jgi:hypothetical protein
MREVQLEEGGVAVVSGGGIGGIEGVENEEYSKQPIGI